MPPESSEVVVNTGPLIALAACGQVDLLNSLHSRVIVPDPVVAEVQRGNQALRALTVTLPEWLKVVPLNGPPSALLQAVLDEGEAAVIALAKEIDCRLVVIDERRGRMVARLEGLEVTGTVGLLLRAKRKGLVTEVKPLLEAMRTRGIWLSNRLLEFVLHEAKET